MSSRWSAGLLLFLASCGTAPARAPVRFEGPHRLPGLDGREHDIREALDGGSKVVLVFWQPWCSTCLREGPEVAAAARSFAAGSRFFGVVSGPDASVDDAEVRRAAAKLALPYPQLRDRTLELTGKLAVAEVPTFVILGTDGAVLYHGHRPPRDWSVLLGPAGPAPLSLESGDVQVEGDLRLREISTWVMGTDLQIRTIGRDAALLDKAMAGAVAEMRRIEDLMTDWTDSELTRLNDAAGKGPRQVPQELAGIISRSIEMHRLTGGAFDISYSAAGRLWDYKKRSPVIPSPEAVALALKNIGAQRIRVDLEKSAVDLPDGMKIGLGGIAKGHAVDQAMAVLMKSGIENAIIKAGGDMKILGKKFSEPWEIAIKHPRNRDLALAALRLSNTCLSTSGDYERFFEVDGKRYHHIIDPRTGYPSQGCMSASVIAPVSELADVLATALCVLGPEEGLKLIESLDRVEAVLVGMDGGVRVTKGLQGAVPAEQQGKGAR